MPCRGGNGRGRRRRSQNRTVRWAETELTYSALPATVDKTGEGQQESSLMLPDRDIHRDLYKIKAVDSRLEDHTA